MAVWRLIAHHDHPGPQIEAFRRLGCIAIGWSDVGDLREIDPRDAAAITRRVHAEYEDLKNAHLGGPSLWRFYAKMAVDDLVIVGDGRRRRTVMRVTGPYVYTTAAQARAVREYQHRRSAVLDSSDPNALWAACGSRLAAQENIRWTLARCAQGRIRRYS